MMKFVVASNNAKKLAEMCEIFSEIGVSVISLRDAGIVSEPEETGATFEENAFVKARAAMLASGLPAIADDSGLCVSALDEAPGVYSARYGGDGLSDEDRVQLLLRQLGDESIRDAKFVCAVACVFTDGSEFALQGECAGEITKTPRGSEGFGYDPVFLPEGLDNTMAELMPPEKNKISHRGKALRMLKKELERRYVDK